MIDFYCGNIILRIKTVWYTKNGAGSYHYVRGGADGLGVGTYFYGYGEGEYGNGGTK